MRFKQEILECSEEMEMLRGLHDTSSAVTYKEIQESHDKLLVEEEIY
jgi:hypothetical protein